MSTISFRPSYNIEMIEEEERVKLWFYMMRKREMFGDEAFWETWFGKGDWYKRLV